MKQPEAFIFDLDGTLYLGDDVIAGAPETLEWVRNNNAKVRFVTNNPRYSKRFYVKKLETLDIKANDNEVVTSAELTAHFLKTNLEYGNIYMIGEEQLRKELLAAGVPLVDNCNADTVVVSFDTTLTYEKLMNGYRALKAGARFIATNPDPVCPTPNGGLVDAGAIIAALEVSSGRKIEKVIGKPSLLLAKLLIDQLDVPAESCVMVGDRLGTDIRLGKTAGMTTVWVKGNKNENHVNELYHPDFTITSIKELPKELEDLYKIKKG